MRSLIRCFTLVINTQILITRYQRSTQLNIRKQTTEKKKAQIARRNSLQTKSEKTFISYLICRELVSRRSSQRILSEVKTEFKSLFSVLFFIYLLWVRLGSRKENIFHVFEFLFVLTQRLFGVDLKTFSFFCVSYQLSPRVLRLCSLLFSKGQQTNRKQKLFAGKYQGKT